MNCFNFVVILLHKNTKVKNCPYLAAKRAQKHQENFKKYVRNSFCFQHPECMVVTYLAIVCKQGVYKTGIFIEIDGFLSNTLYIKFFNHPNVCLPIVHFLYLFFGRKTTSEAIKLPIGFKNRCRPRF